MNEHQYARSFKELVVYHKAREVSKRIFEVTQRFPPDERFSLTDQIRRSSRSIGGQIAEAWAKRNYPKHFVSKLADADGEQLETQHWIEIAEDCGYLEKELADHLVEELEQIGKMLNSMILKAESFCAERPASVKEQTCEYFLTSPTDPSTLNTEY